jgi:hypothetical protein
LILIFATCHDEPTRCSHWVAQRTRERLTAEGLGTAALEGTQATRDSLERSLAGETTGLAFFGHGSPDGLYAEGVAVLDTANLHVLRARWVHAFACRAGVQLAAEAVAAGAVCFAGYRSSLLIDWDPRDIPQPIYADFVQLVTQTTLELARGVHDDRALVRAAIEAQARIMEWCDAHPEQANGLQIMAQQLLSSLVVRRPGAPT